MRTPTLGCAFLSLLCSISASAAAITIMPLGDSITAGYTGDPSQDAPGGYRNNLYADLTAVGIDINFVGTSTQNPSPLLTANNETENEGASGYLIQGVPLAGYPGGFYPGLYENIDTWFSSFQPNIVLLMIGTNDINMNIDLANAPARLGMLLDKITADDPGGLIVLSTLIYTTDPTLNPLVAAYNAALPGVAATRSNVVLVDNSNVLDLSTDYASTLHPNQQGYNKLGDAFAAELEGVIAPEPSSVWLAGLGLVVVAWRAGRAVRPPFGRGHQASDRLSLDAASQNLLQITVPMQHGDHLQWARLRPIDDHIVWEFRHSPKSHRQS